jgi:very-short-patch-repair endonuclease
VNDAISMLFIRQAGVISRAQALSAGLTAAQIDYLIKKRDWRRARPGVYRHALVPPSPEGSLRANALWLGAGFALTGCGAAWWWDMLPDPPPFWHFVTGAPGHKRGQVDVRLTRGYLDPYDLTFRLDVRVISRPLAVLRAAVQLEELQPGRGIALIDRAKQRRWVGAHDLERAFARNKGTWGTQSMRRLLDRTGDRAHSELERLAVGLLRAAGISGFVVNFHTTLSSGRRVEFDIAFRERRVALELDGYAYHSDPEDHQADLRRANEVMADGWVLRRFTYSDLLTDPDGFIATVREVLAH